MKKFITALVAVLLVSSVAAPAANAQVYYTNYSPNSQEETIAYLQSIVAQLVAQLEARGYGVQYHYNYDGYRNYGQYRAAQVRQNFYQPNYPTYSSDVRVETRYASYSNDEVDLYGSVDLKNTSYAYAWFEYGQDDDDMDEDTAQKKFTRDSSFNATLDLDDLDEDAFYYYRAVAKDDDGDYDYGVIRSFYVSDGGSSSRSDDDEPEATTYSAINVDEDEAELRGKVEMNDFRNGYVFFVYGEDEDQVEDVEDEDTYSDIDEDGDDLQKVVADSDLDGDKSYWFRVWGLDDNTDHYYRICVEYEDEDDDETLECGEVEHFETD